MQEFLFIITQQLPECRVGVLEEMILIDEDAIGGLFHQHPVFLHRLPELVLDLLQGPEVAEDADGCDGFRFGIQVGHGNRYGDKRPVFVVNRGLFPHDPPGDLLGALIQDGQNPVTLARHHEIGYVGFVIEHILGAIPRDLLGGLVKD